jgi:hypothetical protein
LQDLSESNFGYKFVIYKHGPFSFELNNELTAMRAANILEFQFPRADWFAANDVRYLEKVATAYYVTKKNPRDPAVERAKKLKSLKPHVDIQAAEEAVRIVDEKRNHSLQREIAV